MLSVIQNKILQILVILKILLIFAAVLLKAILSRKVEGMGPMKPWQPTLPECISARKICKVPNPTLNGFPSERDKLVIKANAQNAESLLNARRDFLFLWEIKVNV